MFKKKIFLLLVALCLFYCNELQAAGSAAGDTILFSSSNISIMYTAADSSTISENGTSYAINDHSINILEINGLIEIETYDMSHIAGVNPSININLLAENSYTGIPDGEYLMQYTYMNRGNTNEDIGITANISGAEPADRWNIFPQRTTINLAEDQVHTFKVSLNVTAPYALDEVTLSINIGLENPTNVVSYNAFNNAYVYFAGAPQYAEYGTAYGGTGNFSYQYELQAEGYNLKYLLREKEVTAPSEYTAYGGTNLTDPVPGSKITYTTQVINNNTSVAHGVNIKDIIPNNCHLFPGSDEIQNIISGSWDSSVGYLPGEGTEVGWDNVYISPNTTITVKYTVTID